MSVVGQLVVDREGVLVDDRGGGRRQDEHERLVGLVQVEDHRRVVGRLDGAVGQAPGSSASPLLIEPSSTEEPLGSAISMLRWNENSTSEEVSSSPLENVAPSRQLAGDRLRVVVLARLRQVGLRVGAVGRDGHQLLEHVVLEVPRAEVVGAGRVDRRHGFGGAEDPGSTGGGISAVAAVAAVTAARAVVLAAAGGQRAHQGTRRQQRPEFVALHLHPLRFGAPAARRGRYRAQLTPHATPGPRRAPTGLVAIPQRFRWPARVRTGRFAAVTPASESANIRRSPSRIGTWLGTQARGSRRSRRTGRRCWSPRSPGSRRVDTQQPGGLEVGVGVRLAPLDGVAGDHGGERPAPAVRRGSARRTAGRTSSPGRTARRPRPGRRAARRPRPPRHRDPDLLDHPVEELLDDLGGLQVDPHVLADVAARLEQVVADQVQGVLLRSRCRRAARRARARSPSSRARCRPACRPCPTSDRGGCERHDRDCVAEATRCDAVTHRGRSRGSARATARPRRASSPCGAA